MNARRQRWWWRLWLMAVVGCPLLGYALALLEKSKQLVLLVAPTASFFGVGLVLHFITSIVLGCTQERGTVGAGFLGIITLLVLGWLAMMSMAFVGCVLPGAGTQAGG